ncbi:hypothetical protein ACVXG9_10830 [Escherichia coli]
MTTQSGTTLTLDNGTILTGNVAETAPVPVIWRLKVPLSGISMVTPL